MLQTPFSHRRLHLKVSKFLRSVEPTVTIYDCFTEEEEQDDRGPLLDEIGTPIPEATICICAPIEGTAIVTTNISMVATMARIKKVEESLPFYIDLFEENNCRIHGRNVKRRVSLCRRRAS